MDEKLVTKILKQEMSSEIQAGYTCTACGVVTITYNDVVPAVCQNCGVASPVLAWKHKLTVVETTESV